MNGTSHTEKAAAAAVGRGRGNNLVAAKKGENKNIFKKAYRLVGKHKARRKAKLHFRRHKYLAVCKDY